MTISLAHFEDVFRVLDRALVTALGGSESFAESPPIGTTVAITDPDTWERRANDVVVIKGKIWVIRGCATYPEARTQGAYLSSQMQLAERACQDAYNTLPQFLKGQTINFVQTINAGYNSWPIEVSGKLQNALQETPWLVQIRPGFEMGLSVPIY